MGEPRHTTFKSFLRRQFPFPVQKLPLDAGFTCPNRDGTLARGGCTYCDNATFSPFARGPEKPIRQQVAESIAYYRARGWDGKFMAYFQAFSNTYSPVEHLRAVYEEGLDHPDVVGISIGTRPDCVPDPVLDLIQSYTMRAHVWIEYGLESRHDASLRRLNRAHGFAAFEDAVRRTQGRGIRICGHLILGLPGETHAMMMESVQAAADLGLDGVKLHHLYLARGTPLERDHLRGHCPVLSLAEYVHLVCDALERLPEPVVLHRLLGELEGPLVSAPAWGRPKHEILSAIDAELVRRGTRQGARASQAPVSRLPQTSAAGVR